MSDREDMATPKTFGDYPPELLRFFEKKEYAEQFLAGVIRLGSLFYYKSDADQECDADEERNDPSEGRGLITAQVENVVTVKTNIDFDRIKISEAQGYWSYHLSYAGPLYILSFTDPQKADIAKLKKTKLGKHVVQITDPRRLGQQLTDRFSKLDSTDPFCGMIVQCFRVRYDENEHQDTEPMTSDLFELSVAQKPAQFAEQCEVRLVVPTEMHKFEKDKDGKRVFGEHYCFDLGGSLNYAQILDEKT